MYTRALASHDSVRITRHIGLGINEKKIPLRYFTCRFFIIFYFFTTLYYNTLDYNNKYIYSVIIIHETRQNRFPHSLFLSLIYSKHFFFVAAHF